MHMHSLIYVLMFRLAIWRDIILKPSISLLSEPSFEPQYVKDTHHHAGWNASPADKTRKFLSVLSPEEAVLKTFAPENAETTLPRYMKEKWYHVEFILAEPVSCRETMQKVEQNIQT